MAIKTAVAAIDRGEPRETPHTPCPLVQPEPSRVPKPTRSPAPINTGVGAATTIGGDPAIARYRKGDISNATLALDCRRLIGFVHRAAPVP